MSKDWVGWIRGEGDSESEGGGWSVFNSRTAACFCPGLLTLLFLTMPLADLLSSGALADDRNAACLNGEGGDSRPPGDDDGEDPSFDAMSFMVGELGTEPSAEDLAASPAWKAAKLSGASPSLEKGLASSKYSSSENVTSCSALL